jgi:hypothetical protein
MTTTDTITALCHALDECPEDEVSLRLSVLADALEEAGDPLVESLRPASVYQPLRFRGWMWERCDEDADPDECLSHHIGADLFAVLAENAPLAEGGYAYYPTRSAAYLALAEALAKGD